MGLVTFLMQHMTHRHENRWRDEKDSARNALNNISFIDTVHGLGGEASIKAVQYH